MTELAPVERLVPATPASIVNLHDFKQVCDFAKMIANTQMVPQHFQRKPEAIVVAIQWGVEIGVPPMQALQNIAVINGRPSIWGDLGKAIVQSHPELAAYSETYDPGLQLAQVTIQRRRSNGAEIAVTGDFSWQDAVDAGLAGKDTYKKYARDMLTWRAFWRAARATFADALRGLTGAEEARDMEPPEKPAEFTISEGAAELNAALGKKEPEEPPSKATETETPLPEVSYRPATPEDLERGSGMVQEAFDYQDNPAPDSKHALIRDCEQDLDRLNIQKDAWLATARELRVDVPERAASLRGLSIDALKDLQAKLRAEVDGG